MRCRFAEENPVLSEFPVVLLVLTLFVLRVRLPVLLLVELILVLFSALLPVYRQIFIFIVKAHCGSSFRGLFCALSICPRIGIMLGDGFRLSHKTEICAFIFLVYENKLPGYREKLA